MDVGTVKLFDITEIQKILFNSLKTTEVHIDNFAVSCASNSMVGFMGEYFRLEVSIKNKKCDEVNQQLYYFVKSIPITNEIHRNECERKGFFNKETSLYGEILPNIQRFAFVQLFPECYYTRRDLIVLEDLSLSPYGFKQCTSNEEYTLEHYRIVLKYLAILHASSIAWEVENNINIGDEYNSILKELALNMSNEWYETGIKGIIYLAKIHPKYQSSALQKFIDEELLDILSNIEILAGPSDQKRNVLCHRDCHNRNIFYSYDDDGKPTACCFVDFQLSRYSPPAIDVLFFLYNTTSLEKYREISEECLQYYHNCLKQSFKSLKLSEHLITWQEFSDDCKSVRLAVLVLMAICIPLLKMPENVTNKLRKEDPKTFDHYLNRDRSELFRRLMPLDQSYKDVVMQYVEELIDYILENNKQ